MVVRQRLFRRAKKRPARPYHHGNLKQALLDRALKLVLERGGLDFSIRDLTDAVGVTQPAFYRCFSDKQELVATLCLEGFRMMGELQQKALQESGPDPWDRLIALLRAYIEFATSNPGYFHIMFESWVPNASNIRPLVLPTFNVVVDVVRECQRAGRILPGDARDYAIVVWAAVHGLTALFLDGPLSYVLEQRPERAKRLEETVAAVVMRGLQGAADRNRLRNVKKNARAVNK